jgi:hypothetical protein
MECMRLVFATRIAEYHIMFLSGDFGFIELTHAAEIVCAEVVLAISDSSLKWNDNPLPTSNRFFYPEGLVKH